MMKSWHGACVAVALLGLAGCITIPSIPGLPSIPGATITNAPPATVSGQIAAGAFARPTIAVGHDGALYVAAEGAKMGSINLWVNAGKGWKGGKVVRASKATAGRCYVPRMVVDAEGWCWLSFRWGNKEYGTLHGPGVWIRAPAGADTSSNCPPLRRRGHRCSAPTPPRSTPSSAHTRTRAPSGSARRVAPVNGSSGCADQRKGMRISPRLVAA